MKLFRNISLTILILTFTSVVFLCAVFNFNVKAVDKNDNKKIEVVIPEGASKKDIGKILEEHDLIRNDDFFNIYVKLFNVGDLKASTYYLSRNMDLKKIIEVLEKGNSYNPEQIIITFKEGINIRKFATIVSEKTIHSYEDVLDVLSNDKFLDELIKKYWFVADDIKNDKIYYSLEGYLFPDTYYFKNNGVSVEDIVYKMLDKMEDVLEPYKEEIKSSKYSVHELLTLASVVEKEGKTKDFSLIATVFYNRIDKSMELGSCATAYYGMGMDFNEVGIANGEMMSNDNRYNTYVIKGMPVGPISLPSRDAIKAVLNREDNNYLFFLSDNQGKTYFFDTYSEHQQKEKELKQAGKWYR